jgi:hypothetical protein
MLLNRVDNSNTPAINGYYAPNGKEARLTLAGSTAGKFALLGTLRTFQQLALLQAPSDIPPQKMM